MPQKLVLSVCIPTFNRPDQLRAVLESVTNQSYRNIEILVSDNCSTDPQVERVIQEFVKEDGRIQSFNQSENIGPINNFSFLLEKASGAYLIWVSDDDKLGSRDYLLKLMNEIEKGFDFAFSNVHKFNLETGQEVENKPVKFTSHSEKWYKHLEIIRKMYIGYQVVGGVYNTELLRQNVSIWFRSSYYEYPDEEPFFHFMVSRYNWSYVKDIFYVKDMTYLTMRRMTFMQILMPNFWNFVAVAGIIAEAQYKSVEKVQLIFWKLLRNLYIQYKMVVK